MKKTLKLSSMILAVCIFASIVTACSLSEKIIGTWEPYSLKHFDDDSLNVEFLFSEMTEEQEKSYGFLLFMSFKLDEEGFVSFNEFENPVCIYKIKGREVIFYKVEYDNEGELIESSENAVFLISGDTLIRSDTEFGETIEIIFKKIS